MPAWLTELSVMMEMMDIFYISDVQNDGYCILEMWLVYSRTELSKLHLILINVSSNRPRWLASGYCVCTAFEERLLTDCWRTIRSVLGWVVVRTRPAGCSGRNAPTSWPPALQIYPHPPSVSSFCRLSSVGKNSLTRGWASTFVWDPIPSQATIHQITPSLIIIKFSFYAGAFPLAHKYVCASPISNSHVPLVPQTRICTCLLGIASLISHKYLKINKSKSKSILIYLCHNWKGSFLDSPYARKGFHHPPNRPTPDRNHSLSPPFLVHQELQALLSSDFLNLYTSLNSYCHCSVKDFTLLRPGLL